MAALVIAWACVPVHAAAPTTAPAPAVESVSLATTQPMPAVPVVAEMEGVRLLVEQGLKRLPEGAVLRAAVTTAPRVLRLTPEQSAALARGFGDVYAKMAADPAFARLPSALPQAISRDADRPGHYFLYRPPEVTPQTPVIVFLHGFGGNMQFYTFLLKSHFSDHVIVCPSWGIAWDVRGAAFLEEALTDAAERTGADASRPWLVALSAGGAASFAFYNAAPDRYAGLVLLATCPYPADVAKADPRLRVLAINGVADDRYRIDPVRRVLTDLRLRAPGTEVKELPNSDHFFILTSPDETFAMMKAFVEGR